MADRPDDATLQRRLSSTYLEDGVPDGTGLMPIDKWR